MELPTKNLAGLQSDIRLAEYTTIGLGGTAKYFVRCQTVAEVRSALEFGNREDLSIMVLGGGSNIIFPDEGYGGLIIKIDLKGIEFSEDSNYTVARVNAGEIWDDFVKLCTEKGFGGVECLSGIPGSVGATPIQNVGAYGQEVKGTIVSVRAIDRKSLDFAEFSATDCRFGYRRSRFKTVDAGKFVIVEVCYRLERSGRPTIKYEELRDYLKSTKRDGEERRQEKGEIDLQTVRGAVLALRKRKSMVIDSSDPNSRSVGSFFVNPVLLESEYENFKAKIISCGIKYVPSYKNPDGIKIPAAWLIESAGFQKGYQRNGVGISSNHALALVNYSGTTKEILSLASEIENAVYEKFGIKLEREAIIVRGS